MANKNRKRKVYDQRKDSHRLSMAQFVGTLITTGLLANYYWQAAKFANPRWANEVECKQKEFKKKCKATVDHLLRREVVVEDNED